MLRSLMLALALAGCIVAGTAGMRTSGPPRPPPPRYEAVEPRAGSSFIQGHWEWQGQWVWIAGHWERERAEQAPPVVVETPPSAPPPSAPPPSNPNAIVQLTAGENHTCTLSASGQIRCWGYNKQGCLGVGSQSDPADGYVTGIEGTVRTIASGEYHTCAITTRGAVWCWGLNFAGQVGTGEASDTPIIKPVRIALDKVRALHMGKKTSCAETVDRTLYCWGDNTSHLFDDSSSRTIAKPTRVRDVEAPDLVAVGSYHLCTAKGGRVRCRGQLEPVNLSMLTNVTALSAGWAHSCALMGGKPYCWGQSYLGILGNGDVCGKQGGECTSQLRPPAAVAGVEGATQLSTGIYHSCVISGGGAVTCWGNNQGHSFSDELPAEPHQTAHLLAGWTADSVHVGGVHVCVVKGGVASCRGNDRYGAMRGAR
ncbi:MAG TPA: hypothetical protein VHN14_00985 [Kofleriaceae bacterium]|nr:hypothetical protein [Kofleriaceae bacterium]